MQNNNKATGRGRMSRIQQLPEALKRRLDELLRAGVSQKDILTSLAPLLKKAEQAPLSRSALNRYAQKMELVGQRIRATREIAEMWTAKFGEQPTGEVGRHIVEMLRTLAFEVALKADPDAVDEDGKPVFDASVINDLALAVQRLERAAELSTKREKELRSEMARQAETHAKKKGISSDLAAAIRAALESDDG